LVEKAKEVHNFKTSLSEGYETEHLFSESTIIENIDFNEIDNMRMLLVCSSFLEVPIILMIFYMYSYPNIM
jgi:hypothetical protein